MSKGYCYFRMVYNVYVSVPNNKIPTKEEMLKILQNSSYYRADIVDEYILGVESVEEVEQNEPEKIVD